MLPGVCFLEASLWKNDYSLLFYYPTIHYCSTIRLFTTILPSEYSLLFYHSTCHSYFTIRLFTVAYTFDLVKFLLLRGAVYAWESIDFRLEVSNMHSTLHSRSVFHNNW